MTFQASQNLLISSSCRRREYFYHREHDRRSFSKIRWPIIWINTMGQLKWSWVKFKKYKIFSTKTLESAQDIKIGNQNIDRKSEALFLDVIIDKKQNWSRHIATIKTKMARYVAIIYKLKRKLPLKACIQIFHGYRTRSRWTRGRRTRGRRRKNGVDAMSANSHRLDARSAAL